MNMDILKIDAPRPFPPRVTAVTQPFWEGLLQSHFLLTECKQCQRMSFPPKPFCPHCWSTETGWKAASGTGTLYSRTTIHFTPQAFLRHAPLAVGIVDLVENVRIVCSLVDQDLAIDARVRLVTLSYDDGPLYGVKAA